MWAISLAGILTESNQSYRNSLNAEAMNEAGKNIWLTVMKRDWDINTREELFETLEILEKGGHSASLNEIQKILIEIFLTEDKFDVLDILGKYNWDQTKINRLNFVRANWTNYIARNIKAWDLGRGISLCRWGYNVGFITEEEAWEKIFYFAKMIRPLYNSWEEYGYDYLLGRLFWASGFGEEKSYLTSTEAIYEKLLSSYWSRIDWNIDLDQEETAIPPVTTNFFLEPDDNDGMIQFRTNDPANYDSWLYAYAPNPNQSPNVYECNVKKLSGSDTYGYGMIFCVDDSDKSKLSFYRLFITVNGSFSISKRIKGATNSWPVNWRYSQYLKTGYNVYNTLRVEREDNKDSSIFRVFINDNLAAVFNDAEPINGSKIGPVVSVNRMEMELFPYIPVDVRFRYKTANPPATAALFQ